MNVLVFFPGEKKALLKGSGLWLKFSIFASDSLVCISLMHDEWVKKHEQ